MNHRQWIRHGLLTVPVLLPFAAPVMAQRDEPPAPQDALAVFDFYVGTIVPRDPDTLQLRDDARITSGFRIPDLGHLGPLLVRKILDVATATPPVLLARINPT